MIQIDMDMPVSCFYCPIKQRILTLGGKCMCFCGLIKHELNDTTKRHESCPLVKVKDGEQKQVQPEHKTGRWIYGESEVGNDGYYCSECGNFVPWIYEESAMNFIREYKFCPNCGAKMDGERKE